MDGYGKFPCFFFFNEALVEGLSFCSVAGSEPTGCVKETLFFGSDVL